MVTASKSRCSKDSEKRDSCLTGNDGERIALSLSSLSLFPGRAINHLMLRALKISLAFLTVFRVKVQPIPELGEVAGSAWAFPLVGAILGGILVFARLAIGSHLPPVLCAVFLVGLWAFLTGGLHLDGWTDCWDAAAAATTPERRYEILKDSRMGTFGGLALILLLAVKASAVADPDLPLSLLFLSPVIGRGAMVAAAYRVRSPEYGMGSLFVQGLDGSTRNKAALAAFLPAVVAGFSGLFCVVSAYIGAVIFRRFAESRLNMVNGDVLGAMVELAEALVLMTALFKW